MKVSPQRFEDKTIVVVGGAGGVGKATVIRALAEGARVAVLDLAPDLSFVPSADADRVRGIAVDVSREESVAAAVADVVDWSPQVHSLLYLVGAIGGKPLEEVGVEEWNRLFAINSTGAFLCAKALIPHLTATAGSVVTVSSVSAAVAGIGKDIAYKAAKAALVQITRTIAIDYADQGIRANVVLPGPIATAFGRGGRIAADDELGTRSGASVPLGRRAAPDEIASAVLFLASEDASYITGVALPVDGGFLAI